MSLLRSIHLKWQNSAALCDAATGVPHDRVFTGRIPQTKQYRFPYVSILTTRGWQTGRTDKTRLSAAVVSFHIWVDDDDLEFAQTLADAIADEFADRCWPISDTASVLDVLDGGEAVAHQTTLPTVKAWEVIKMLTFIIERDRTDHYDDCCDDEYETSSDSTSL